MDKRFIILLAVVGLAGCMPHLKSADSHDSMFANVKPTGYGDPYTNGGIGEASGGLKQNAPADRQLKAKPVEPTGNMGMDMDSLDISRSESKPEIQMFPNDAKPLQTPVQP